VGDAEFQKKSLNKMEQVTQSGRTVLFVSHNLNAVEKLCSKAALLNKGLLETGLESSSEVIKKYLSFTITNASNFWFDEYNQYENEIFKLIDIAIVDRKEKLIENPINNSGEFWFRTTFYLKNLDPLFYFGYALYNSNGELLFWSQSKDANEELWPEMKIGKNVLFTKLPSRLLNEDSYRIELIASIHFRKWVIAPETGPSLFFNIKGGLSDSPYFISKRKGIMAPVYEWKINMA